MPPSAIQLPARPPIEIGVVMAGEPDSSRWHLVHAATAETRSSMQKWFPEFEWVFRMVDRPALSTETRVESSQLLLEADNERDLNQWDFVLLVTPSELIGRYRPFVLAALSRPFDAAILSTARIIQSQRDEQSTESKAILQNRICTLMLHALGHLGGLPQSDDAQRLLFHPDDAANLDPMSHFTDGELEELNRAFTEIADTRLEERSNTSGVVGFYSNAIWINREEIGEAVFAARPWEFPRRLSRLTTAAVSAVAVLLMTAEGWDLGLSQSLGTLTILALGSLFMTTLFVASRQRLFVRRRKRRAEQTVVLQASALLIVLLGLLTTWCFTFLLCGIASFLFFPDSLISSWAGSNQLAESDLGWWAIGKMSFFTASIGLLIGSLGASFEEQHHFQHVIYVDEEI